MQIEILKSKIAHATITDANLEYEGSITIDSSLLKKVDLIPNERVEVLNLNNGNRFTTYIISGKSGSGEICLNGPAARLGLVGDRIIILSYAVADLEEAKTFKPKIIHLNAGNKIKS
jgi:aspartate 1-decarboxylase